MFFAENEEVNAEEFNEGEFHATSRLQNFNTCPRNLSVTFVVHIQAAMSACDKSHFDCSLAFILSYAMKCALANLI